MPENISTASQYPDEDSLRAGLTVALKGAGLATDRIAILRREPNAYASTFPTEVVTCALGGNIELRLFCKYQRGCGHKAFGHRGDIGYEAEVYRHVLRPLKQLVPEFYGAYADLRATDTWLFIEYLERYVPCSKSRDSAEMMLQAARWLGEFHARHADPSRWLPFLNRYTTEYYRGWSQRVWEFSRNLRAQFSWLTKVCENFCQSMELLQRSPTVIHGEFYPANVLFFDNIIKPVDWESTAVAAAEIDLVALIDRWSASVSRSCEKAYREARCLNQTDAEFGKRMDMARLYWHFRWLGDDARWIAHRANLRRFVEIKAIAERWDIDGGSTINGKRSGLVVP